MSTTTLDAITLSENLLWAGRNNWTPVTQATERSLSGALIVQTATVIKGQKISLKGESNTGWMPRSLVEAIQAKLAIPGLQMTLVYKGTTLTVIFDHEAGGLITEQAVPYVDVDGNDWIRVEAINLLTV